MKFTQSQITQGQQDAVSLFEKFAGLLAVKLPKKTQPFFISKNILYRFSQHQKSVWTDHKTHGNHSTTRVCQSRVGREPF